ncbi:sigma-54 dependent transcriptional regulator [Pigmentiphaga soli]|uniref:Sigma-54 dependent transcriptional regulator n=1 Tax=Pigmentiphaga soli TaxID=1007095 RepID=A0ABP8GQ12_9BURK
MPDTLAAGGPDQPFGLLYGTSEPMRNLYRQIERVAATALTVLIIGESGTGKELIAKTIHDKSERAGGPFIPVNCGAIPASLIEGELFGHEKGSFTGALQQHVGYFENAAGGTIFLDEVTEMAPEMQIKLLRVLETGSFHRVGGTEQIQVDVRVIAATNRDPQLAAREGRFREDLLYRLAVIPLRVPPLRERQDDIELLAQRFLDQFNAAEKTSKTFSRRTLEALRQNPWPGNVRELKNAVHRAFILADQVVEFAPPAPAPRGRRTVRKEGSVEVWVGTPLFDAQREIILATLAHFGGDKRQAASTLGISLKTLYNRLETYKAGAKSGG